jgi:futalosine hydrolase
MFSRVLLVAATEIELCEHDGLVCGVGPVEAALTTARALALEPPDAVLHVGVAGAHRITPGSIVVGTQAVYCDINAEVPVETRVEPDPDLRAAMLEAWPRALALPIGTTAAVNGPCSALAETLRVEGMEGFAVLRACALAGVPAVEVRAIANEIDERDRARWQIARGIEALRDALPELLAAAEK